MTNLLRRYLYLTVIVTKAWSSKAQLISNIELTEDVAGDEEIIDENGKSSRSGEIISFAFVGASLDNLTSVDDSPNIIILKDDYVSRKLLSSSDVTVTPNTYQDCGVDYNCSMVVGGGSFRNDGNANTSSRWNESYEDYLSQIEEFIFPRTWTWILIFIHSLVFVIGLVGNTLVCVAVYRNHTMRTVTNYFIVNLAVADFMVILFCLPPTLIWDVTMTWFFGMSMCKIVLYLQSVAFNGSATFTLDESDETFKGDGNPNAYYEIDYYYLEFESKWSDTRKFSHLYFE
ncbi:neuropeptide receptor-related g-protein coupled receptor [Holotrichia oblita]|uniref:Neuropeptide receptor-related g-protein coupled receptor n=1 Tax=Holotrichia oblita TaxID=644536 RepID=A0ACB9TQ13_HOLOL|nr:neuropeptide receptor-related g-protein coupled receptor [Holotrichia oblita]